jgi:hypothetical protein
LRNSSPTTGRKPPPAKASVRSLTVAAGMICADALHKNPDQPRLHFAVTAMRLSQSRARQEAVAQYRFLTDTALWRTPHSKPRALYNILRLNLESTFRVENNDVQPASLSFRLHWHGCHITSSM